jgi:type IV pilus assembly protein PilM
VELAARHISAAEIVKRGTRWVVSAHIVEPLADGLIVPSLTGTNIGEGAPVTATLKQAFTRLGVRPGRIGLVLPDTVAKVSLVSFAQVPPRAEDLERLIRWQVRRTAPFSIDEAQVAWTSGAVQPDGAREFVVALARRSVIDEYEQVCAAAGAQAGLVDLATFNVVNSILAGGGGSSGDWLLVHVNTGYTSFAIVRDGALIFFRSLQADTEGDLADVVHQTAMYYEDRLHGSGFTRIVLSGAALTADEEASALHVPSDREQTGISADVEPLRRTLEARLSAPVDTVDPRTAAALTDRIVAGPALLDALAPLVGVILRETGTGEAAA